AWFHKRHVFWQKLIIRFERVDVTGDESNEAIALFLDTLDDCGTIDFQIGMYAQIFALSRGTRGACRGDEEFGGHASDAGAGCAERATVAQKGGRAESFRGSSCDEAGASGADDDDIYFIVRVRHVLLRSV